MLKVGVWSVALGLVLLAALPWLLSTGLGNRVLVGVINGQIPGTFSAQRVRIGWFGGTGVTGGELRDEAGGIVIGGMDVSAGDLGIVDALRGSGFGEVVVALGELIVEQGPEGATNLERALGLGGPSTDDRVSAGDDDEGAGGLSLPVGLGASVKLTAERVSYTTLGADGARDQTVLKTLDASVDLSDVKRVTAAVTGRLEREGASGVIDAEVALVEALDTDGRIDWRRGGVELDAKVLELPLGPADRLLALNGLLPAALGDRLALTVSAAGALSAPEATVSVRSALLGFDASLTREGDVVRIEPGALLTWRLTPAAFARLMGEPDGSAEAPRVVLREAVDVRLPIEAFVVPVDASGVAIERASGRAEATWSPAELALADGRQVAMSRGVLRLATEALGQRLTAALASDATVSGGSAAAREDRLLVTVNLLDLLPAASASAAASGLGVDVDLERLPVTLVEALAGVDVPGGGLSAWLGPEVSLDAELRLPATDSSPLRLSGRVRSAGVSGPFVVSVRRDGTAGELSTPEPVVLRVEPSVVRDAMGAEAWFALPVGLREALVASLTLRDVRWALLPEPTSTSALAVNASSWETMLARLDPQATLGQIEISVPTVLLQDHRNERPLPELRALRASVAVSDLARPIEAVAGVNFDGPTLPDTPRVGDGGVTIRLTASEMLDRHGRFSPMSGTYDLLLRGTAVPSEVVDAFAGQGGKLAATLGPAIEPEVTARVRMQRDATLEIDVTSTHAVGSVLLAEDLSDPVWRPVLQQDPRFTLAVSEPAVQSWMGRLHPILADVVRSAPDAPAMLTLDRSSFELSEQGFFDLEGIRAQATLDLGRLELRRQGWLRQGLTGIVRQFAPEFRKQQQGPTYVAGFSPMRISIERGVVTTSELWLSADDMGVGFAGSIDLNTNQIDMGLGVLGATFIAAGSDFEKALEPMRVYELPIRGTIDAPRIQVDKFIGQVAAAYGQRELQRNAEKLGGWGQIIGVLGNAVVEDALNWKNTRAWSPSGEAQAFAVSIADPQPAATDAAPQEAAPPADATPAEAKPAEAAPAQEAPKEEDDVQRALRGILDLIGQQRDR